MCGRFVSNTPPEELASYFDAESIVDVTAGPNWNVAPTQQVFVVMSDGSTRVVDALRWGLVPSWAKDPSVAYRMINARAETVRTKPAFRSAFKSRRCIIPADGFYEWKPMAAGQVGGPDAPATKSAAKPKKQPYFIHRPDGEPYAFAGLWERWEGADGTEIRSCSIITGDPNNEMAKLHSRMPIILPPTRWEEWLDPTNDDRDALGGLLVPAPSQLISFHAVSTEVNSARNQGDHLADAIAPEGVLLDDQSEPPALGFA